uniref:Uncharacterized protein n=1 Tax=viral metagenome TaxID=1070528 RepID=A0A6M3Y0Q2_9ZZZZ
MDNKLHSDLMEMIGELREQVEIEKRKRIQIHAEVIRLRKEIEQHKKANVDFYAGLLAEIKLADMGDK